MPVRFLSEAELARLADWPSEVADQDMVTFFTLSSTDVGWLRARYRPDNQIGVAVQLCALPWLGWVPDDLAGCPTGGLARLASALDIEPAAASRLLAGYGGWQGRTRRDHRGDVLNRLGWRLAGPGERKRLDQFLLARAMEHDAPAVLLQLACDWLRREQTVRPPVDALSRRVAGARDAARLETYHRMSPLLDTVGTAELDGLLDVDPELGVTRLAWLRRDATSATPEVLKAELAKLAFLRGQGADRFDLAVLPAGRRRLLAEIGRRSTNQALR